MIKKNFKNLIIINIEKKVIKQSISNMDYEKMDRICKIILMVIHQVSFNIVIINISLKWITMHNYQELTGNKKVDNVFLKVGCVTYSLDCIRKQVPIASCVNKKLPFGYQTVMPE